VQEATKDFLATCNTSHTKSHFKERRETKKPLKEREREMGRE